MIGGKFNWPNVCVIASGLPIDTLLSFCSRLCSVVTIFCTGLILAMSMGAAHVAISWSLGLAVSAGPIALGVDCCCCRGEGLLFKSLLFFVLSFDVFLNDRKCVHLGAKVALYEVWVISDSVEIGRSL